MKSEDRSIIAASPRNLTRLSTPRNREKPIISARRAAELVPDYCTITTGGSGSCGHPDLLTSALAERFRKTQQPTKLTLVFAAGQGDKCERGLNKLAHKNLLKRVIGGHWGLTPALGQLALQGEIEAYSWPQGVISHWFRAVAGGKPGVLTDVGLHTSVDPRHEGGRIGSASTDNLVELVKLGEREHLFYPSQPINVAFLRGTRADIYGNITMEGEANFQDSLVQAQAVHNSGGIVIVQVLEIVDKHSLAPQQIKIPGIFVDYLVEAFAETHWQTYGERFNGSYTGALQGASRQRARQKESMPLNAKKIIARRAFHEIAAMDFPIVSLGIGTPEHIARIADEEKGVQHLLTIESGVIGGTPASGLSFGAASNPQAMLDHSALFDFYDGGGIDIAFLGFGEMDQQGNVNVSRLGNKVNGVGGFINVSQSAKKLVFCGMFTGKGLEIEVAYGRLTVIREGKDIKFVDKVGQIDFNAHYAQRQGQEILVITERAVFRYEGGHLVLAEIAPGIDIQRDIRDRCAIEFLVPDHVALMPANIFYPQSMSSSDAFWGGRN